MKIIAARIGHSNVNNFIAAFKKKYGVTPGGNAQGHEGKFSTKSGLMNRTLPNRLTFIAAIQLVLLFHLNI